MSIYQEIVLDHYYNPRNKGRLENLTHASHVNNPLCGDTITLEAIIEGHILKDIRFHGQGCAISQASASLLTNYAKGKPLDELLRLKSNDVLSMLGIQLSPNRLKCALLSLESLHKLQKKHADNV